MTDEAKCQQEEQVEQTKTVQITVQSGESPVQKKR